MNNMSGEYLSSKELGHKNSNRTPRSQQKTKITKRKIRQRHDVTKTSDNCPSKLDGKMLPSRFGI